MMIMTAKVDMKQILTIIGIIAAILIAIILLFGGNDAATTAAPTVSGNDARVQFLRDFGWDVTSSPLESSQVKIPEESTEIFDRYNALQKQQGYDLTRYAGKNVIRYVYQINNYPAATDPVYATLLVHKNQIIGGDITDTAAQGKIHGFHMPRTTPPTAAPQSTLPATTAPAA